MQIQNTGMKIGTGHGKGISRIMPNSAKDVMIPNIAIVMRIEISQTFRIAA